MAAALVARGARLISDDLSRVEPSKKPVQFYPSAPRMKLWDTAIAHLNLEGQEMHQDHFRDRKFHLSADNKTASATPVSLDAAFVLDWGERLSCERLHGIDAVKALSEATMYRREFLELMGKLPSHVIACTQIAGSIPVYRLTRPKDFALLDAVCDAVEHAIAGGGEAA